MLAQLERPTHDFFALAHYLVQGRERPPRPDRLVWVLAQTANTFMTTKLAHVLAAG